MERISRYAFEEYKYETENERNLHVKEMEIKGWRCSPQVKKLSGSLWDKNKEYYWYAKFMKG